MPPALLPRVAVASDQPLVMEVIAAALSSKGFVCMPVRWPRVPDASLEGEEGAEPVRLPSAPRAAVMLSDFKPLSRIRSAGLLMEQVPTSWVILAGVPRGPLWGALLEMGSVHVAPATTGLDQVAELLVAVADGQEVTPRHERCELLEAWAKVLAEQQDTRARLATMTPREAEVLQLLYAGAKVRTIARQLGVAETTVRTQVKRVLRKLDVRSQLAAVASMELVRLAEEAAGGARRPPHATASEPVGRRCS